MAESMGGLVLVLLGTEMTTLSSFVLISLPTNPLHKPSVVLGRSSVNTPAYLFTADRDRL